MASRARGLAPTGQASNYRIHGKIEETSLQLLQSFSLLATRRVTVHQNVSIPVFFGIERAEVYR
jgi:hypothetical protein